MEILSDHDADENRSEKKKKNTGDVKKEPDITAAGDNNGSIVEMEKKIEAKRSQVRTFANGLVIGGGGNGQTRWQKSFSWEKGDFFSTKFLCDLLCRFAIKYSML